LTSLGRDQAKTTGDWIRENIYQQFDAYYVSEYVRAKETASLLGFEESEWHSEFYLREQDNGVFTSLSGTERKELWSKELERKKLDSFYYAPPGGESIANCCLRVERWLHDLRVNCSGFRVIAVCHGNILKSLRIRIEKMNQENWGLLQTDKYKTHNCQVIHYSRRNPFNGKVGKNIDWVRSICPWDLRRSVQTAEWEEIKRPSFTNEQLFQSLENTPRLINNKEGDNLENLKEEQEYETSPESD